METFFRCSHLHVKGFEGDYKEDPTPSLTWPLKSERYQNILLGTKTFQSLQSMIFPRKKIKLSFMCFDSCSEFLFGLSISSMVHSILLLLIILLVCAIKLSLKGTSSERKVMEIERDLLLVVTVEVPPKQVDEQCSLSIIVMEGLIYITGS